MTAIASTSATTTAMSCGRMDWITARTSSILMPNIACPFLPSLFRTYDGLGIGVRYLAWPGTGIRCPLLMTVSLQQANRALDREFGNLHLLTHNMRLHAKNAYAIDVTCIRLRTHRYARSTLRLMAARNVSEASDNGRSSIHARLARTSIRGLNGRKHISPPTSSSESSRPIKHP